MARPFGFRPSLFGDTRCHFLKALAHPGDESLNAIFDALQDWEIVLKGLSELEKQQIPSIQGAESGSAVGEIAPIHMEEHRHDG